MSMLTPALTALRTSNWHYLLLKWSAIVALVVGWTYHWHSKGWNDCLLEQSEARVVQVESVYNERLPVVQQAERRAAQLEQELRTLKEKLDEEALKPIATDCRVSDEQLRIYRELANKTRR